MECFNDDVFSLGAGNAMSTFHAERKGVISHKLGLSLQELLDAFIPLHADP